MHLMSCFRTMIVLAFTALPPPALAQLPEGAVLTPVVQGLDQPWGIAVLPEGGVLVTERAGTLLFVKGKTRISVQGLPKVAEVGQGGLLDITLARDFASSRMLYLTYAKKQRRGAGTALATARLSKDGARLTQLKDIFVMKPGSKGGRHFGSRVVEGSDGFLYLSIGDRGDRPAAQDRARHQGSIIRVSKQGAVPADNPFIDIKDAQPELWTYGHRNPQGMDIDAKGRIWTSEHGAKGGDEVNLIQKGANYGWPVISYGRHYSGKKIGEGTAKTGMQQPQHYWDPSIAPSGLLAYSGNMFPELNGHLLVGSLKFDYISVLSTDPVKEVTRIKTPEMDRVRDIIQAEDNSIWFISAGNGTVYRIGR